jgi:hypothetical protein
MRLWKVIASSSGLLLCLVCLGGSVWPSVKPRGSRAVERASRTKRGRETAARGRDRGRDSRRGKEDRYADRRERGRDRYADRRERGRDRYARRDSGRNSRGGREDRYASRDRRSDRYERSALSSRGRLADRRRGGRYESRYDRRYESRYDRRHESRYERRRESRYERRSESRDQRRSYARYSEPEERPSAPAHTLSGIPSDRVTEIQRALIKNGYLTGDPSGQYDGATTAAMKQFQSGNKFHATGLPSAESLKKLGVSKRSNDGYAVPVNSGTNGEKKPRVHGAGPEGTGSGASADPANPKPTGAQPRAEPKNETKKDK